MNAVFINQRNLQFLIFEMYKAKNKLNPNFICEIFKEQDLQYNLRNASILTIPNTRTSTFGIEMWHIWDRKYGTQC